MESKFPKDFLWGAATASHQIEGGLTNNWSKWEEENAQRLSKDGQRPTLSSLVESFSNPENYRSNSKYSPESFKYWKEDLKVIKELNLKAYRLSIEWSRIQPRKGFFDKDAIKYYKEYLSEIKQNNIKIILTCWHWTIPLWIEEEGGLLSKEIHIYFKEYVQYLVDELSDFVDYWITINEPESFANSYLTGKWPPQRKNIILFYKVYQRILPKMHIDAYKIIKKKNKDNKVSLSKSISFYEPYKGLTWNRALVWFTSKFINTSTLDKVIEYVDYLGINFYFYNKVDISGLKNDNDKVSDLGWWLKPDKLYNVIKLVNDRYHLPILITENGLADSRDIYRKWWIGESVKAMNNAINDGCNVFGYLHWSLLDNFEWDKGYWPKFGLVSIDPKTKERRIKKSGRYYSKIIKENGIIYTFFKNMGT